MIKSASKVTQKLTKKESAEKLKSGYLDALINPNSKDSHKVDKSESSVSEGDFKIIPNETKQEDSKEEEKFQG